MRAGSSSKLGRLAFALVAACLVLQPLGLLLHLALGHAHAPAGAAHGHEHRHGHDHDHVAGHSHADPPPAPSRDDEDPEHPLEDHFLDGPPLAIGAPAGFVLLAMPSALDAPAHRLAAAHPLPERAATGPRAPPPRSTAPPRAPPIAS
jgi:hypothetical protein